MLSNSLPILYSFRRCPYAMRARLAILSSGIACELREVALRNKPAHLLSVSPKGTVPVLISLDGQVIEQSWDIMLWALRQNDPAHWLPTDTKVFEQGLGLLNTCDGEFKQQLDRYKYPQRDGEDRVTHDRDASMPFLSTLETRLAQQRFLFGSNFGLFDAALLPFIRQFAHVDMDWFAGQTLPHIQAWLAAFEGAEDFKRVMKVYPTWSSVASISEPITPFP